MFLSVFKWEERKGWDVLLKAYFDEFKHAGDDSNVVLVILTNAYHSSDGTREFWKEAMARLAEMRREEKAAAAGEGEGGDPERVLDVDEDEDDENSFSSSPGLGKDGKKDGSADHPPVVFHRRVAQQELPALYAGADCFVLPSRGEGWGRPHVEAMAMGLPVVATNWSGPTEFLDEANGYPLRLDPKKPLVAVREGAFKGHLWANPSVAHLRELLRRVYEDPNAARAKGRAARRDMVEKYSPEVLGREAKRLLVALEADYYDAASQAAGAGMGAGAAAAAAAAAAGKGEL